MRTMVMMTNEFVGCCMGVLPTALLLQAMPCPELLLQAMPCPEVGHEGFLPRRCRRGATEALTLALVLPRTLAQQSRLGCCEIIAPPHHRETWPCSCAAAQILVCLLQIPALRCCCSSLRDLLCAAFVWRRNELVEACLFRAALPSTLFQVLHP